MARLPKPVRTAARYAGKAVGGGISIMDGSMDPKGTLPRMAQRLTAGTIRSTLKHPIRTAAEAAVGGAVGRVAEIGSSLKTVKKLGQAAYKDAESVRVLRNAKSIAEEAKNTATGARMRSRAMDALHDEMPAAEKLRTRSAMNKKAYKDAADSAENASRNARRSVVDAEITADKTATKHGNIAWKAKRMRTDKPGVKAKAGAAAGAAYSTVPGYKHKRKGH